MDPRDHLRDSLAGVGCTACGAGVPADRIDVLAERDDLVFVQFRCIACGSEALGLVVIEDEQDGAGRTVTADMLRYGEFGAADEARLTGPAIGEDDVRRMHTFLERHTGDLRSILEGPGGTGTGAG
jgi:hypothetical protein